MALLHPEARPGARAGGGAAIAAMTTRLGSLALLGMALLGCPAGPAAQPTTPCPACGPADGAGAASPRLRALWTTWLEPQTPRPTYEMCRYAVLVPDPDGGVFFSGESTEPGGGLGFALYHADPGGHVARVRLGDTPEPEGLVVFLDVTADRVLAASVFADPPGSWRPG